MSFEIFLTQCQKMFNIYEKEGEEISDEAKIGFLFRKVQHTGHRSSIDALKASQTTGMTIYYTWMKNICPQQLQKFKCTLQRTQEMLQEFK